MQTSPTNLPPKMKKWDNLGNYWLIKLKFGMQVPFTRPHVIITFGDDPSIFYRPTRPTKKLPIAKFQCEFVLDLEVVIKN